MHIRDSIEIFTRDWLTTRRLNEAYSQRAPNYFDGKPEPPFEKQFYEIDFVTRNEYPPDHERATFDKDLLKVRSCSHSLFQYASRVFRGRNTTRSYSRLLATLGRPTSCCVRYVRIRARPSESSRFLLARPPPPVRFLPQV